MSENQYKTKQRTVILSCLRSNKEKALTVDEICEKLRETGVSVGRTTVYRYLDSLLESGSVRKFLEQKGKSATFQYVESSDCCLEHLHIKCTSCGKLVHLSCDFLNEVCSHIMLHHNFRVDNSKTTILGLCDNCYKKEQNNGTH